MSPIRLPAFGLLLSLFAATLPSQDVVDRWNHAALDAIRATNTPPPAATRQLAMLHAGMFDAINGINPRFDAYLVEPGAPRNASPEAAGSAAAREVLVTLLPSQAAVFDVLHDQILAGIRNPRRRDAGVVWGQQVAGQVLAARTGDGSEIPGSYPGSTDIGVWRPTVSFGGVVRPALLPNWGNVEPFVLDSGDQFRPAPPPAIRSFRYALEQAQVQIYGRADSSIRSADQSEIAYFWGYGPGTATPPGHWNEIAHVALRQRPQSLLDTARLFALLNLALADAAIVSWDCKYEFGLWRPITSIPLAGEDGNFLTFADPDWTPLLETPPFPEYTSGHSTFSGAAATVLAGFFGTDRIAFDVGSDDLPGVTRHYDSFSAAAWESGLSRIYGGIHFWSANVNGLRGGAQTARVVLESALRPRSRR